MRLVDGVTDAAAALLAAAGRTVAYCRLGEIPSPPILRVLFISCTLFATDKIRGAATSWRWDLRLQNGETRGIQWPMGSARA